MWGDSTHICSTTQPCDWSKWPWGIGILWHFDMADLVEVERGDNKVTSFRIIFGLIELHPSMRRAASVSGWDSRDFGPVISRQDDDSSNGHIFHVTGPLFVEFTGHQWIPLTKASDAELCCFLCSALNKRLSKQSWGWWFETPSRSLWRQRNKISGNLQCLKGTSFHSIYWMTIGVDSESFTARWCHSTLYTDFILSLP